MPLINHERGSDEKDWQGSGSEIPYVSTDAILGRNFAGI